MTLKLTTDSSDLDKKIEEAKNQMADKSPQKDWLDYMMEGLSKGVAPHGFKKFKNGTVVSRLDYLTQTRCEEIVHFGVSLMANKDKRVEQDLNQELLVLRQARMTLENQKQEAKKKWFNRKELKEIETQIEQVGSMAVGVERAIRLFRAVKRLG